MNKYLSRIGVYIIFFIFAFSSIPITNADGLPPTDIAFGRPATPFSVADGHNIVTPKGNILTDISDCDDCSENVIISDTISDGLKLGDTVYDSIYVGTNGYITFGHSQRSFSPEGISGYSEGPMIAGQYDDIDLGTSSPNHGDVYVYKDSDNNIVSITWYEVGPYSSPDHNEGEPYYNSFQLRLHGLGNGDFGIELRYEDIRWIEGNSGHPTAGWTVGDGETYGEVNDSKTEDFLSIEDESNIGQPGVFAWNVNNGGVLDIETSIDENSVGGTFVGNLTASDPDTDIAHLNFSLLDDDNGNFKICNDSETGTNYVAVNPGADLDYETSPNHQRQITVQAEDPDGNTGSSVLNITLLDEQIEFTNETIYHQKTNVRPDTSEWSVDITHPSGSLFQWWINTSPDVGSASGTSTNTQINPTLNFQDLKPRTTYTVHVTVRGSDHEKNYTFTTGSFVSNSSWYNNSRLNVTVEHQYPRILWYDIQKYTGEKTGNDQQLPASTSESDWTSVRNNMTEVDNATWLRVVLNVSSDQGWENIEYINISGWHDNGSDGDGSGYNTSGNHGSNRNFFLCYDNTSDSSAFYNKSWPKGSVEVTKGNMTERNVSDVLGISSTETRNLSFQFKPGYQFRYAPGPDGTGDTWMNFSVENSDGYPRSDGSGVVDYETSSWEALNNSWSWNLNVSVTNKGLRSDGGSFSESSYSSWVLDEFGVYSYTEIVSAGGDVSIQGAPGGNYSTNSSNPFNSESENVSLQTRSNGNYSLCVHIDDLLHTAASGLGYDRSSAPDHLILENDTVWVRGGTRSSRLNFSDEVSRWWISLYGSCNDATGIATDFESHEVNGTSKFAGELGTDGLDDLYPDDYNETVDVGSGLRAYGGLNDRSFYVEFTCSIPLGAWAGVYSTHVYYHLQTEII